MKNIIASYMKRTASLEDNILEYLENTSDSELFDITMTINHYSGEFDFMNVMDMSDLEESVSDMSPIDLINIGKNGFDTSNQWYRHDGNKYESVSTEQLVDECKEYIDEIAEVLANPSLNPIVYRYLPQDLQDIIDEGENEEGENEE